MVNGPGTSYQPAIAYQGGQVNTPQQDPRTDRTQPIQAPAADTQHGGSHDQSASDSASRGKTLNVKA